jgi:hypothetical protein
MWLILFAMLAVIFMAFGPWGVGIALLATLIFS